MHVRRQGLGAVAAWAVGAALLGEAAGCSSSDSGPQLPAATEPPTFTTQSGRIAAVQVSGRLKLYIPLQAGVSPPQVAVVDGGRPGAALANPARIGTVDLSRGTADTDFASAIAGDATGLIAVGVTFPKIWFIDPVTDKVTSVLTLPASYGTSTFSGRSPYVTGVVVDSPRRRAYLGVYNGFAVVDLDRKAIVDVIPAPPSESFGYDPVRHRLLAPFYNCALALAGPGGQAFPCDSVVAADGTTVITDGLNLLDVDTKALYTLHDPAAADPAAPVGLVPDSAAVDPTTGVAVVAAEGPGDHARLDLSAVTLDAAKRAFTVPAITVTANAPLTGVAFVPDGSFAFAMQESTDLVGVYDSGATTLLRARLPDLPGAVPWVNGADPHPLAAARYGGKAYGFVANQDATWVARIDLAAYRALPHAGADLTPAEVAPAVALLDAVTAP